MTTAASRPSTRSGRPEPAGGRHLLTAAYTVGGAALFAYVVRRAGVAEIVAGIQRVGWGLTVILALAGLRFLVRAACWRLCMPPAAQLTYGRAFSAFLAGDAVGSVTPLGLLASEPTKIFLTRHDLATRDSVASLATENLIYGASILAMLAVAVGVVLATVPLAPAWRWGIAASLLAAFVAAVVLLRLLRGTWDERRGPRPRWRARLAQLRVAVLGFSTVHRDRLWRAFALEMVFHVLGTLEVFLTLQWLVPDRAPTLAQAVAFEGLNRVVTVAFKFVPFRIGVDEALSGAVAPILAVAPAAGVALAVVRKVRNLFWSGVGLAIIAAHPARCR
ncbi:MAG: flippase-like domain-containing protein [Acidobacteria bacterium]|nr:flippase-like domain-containing protein [Acidobacteriota bacterium]